MAKIVINLKEYDAVAKEINEWYGVGLTAKQMKEVLANNTHLLCHVADDVIVEKDYSGLGSTAVREDVIDHIATELTGEDWPCGCISTKKIKAFYVMFKTKALKAGYEINFDEEI